MAAGEIQSESNCVKGFGRVGIEGTVFINIEAKTFCRGTGEKSTPH